jgi:hypothetical protein
MGTYWYKGNYQSVIQINTDLNIFVDRAIDVGSHESYPGHTCIICCWKKTCIGTGLMEFLFIHCLVHNL